MRPIYRVARATFWESWRRRFLNGILVFAILIIGSSWVFTYLQPGAELKMLIDVGLGSIRFFGMLIAVFLGTRLIPDEIEKRTIYTLLSKPVTRTQFLLGKFFGGLTTVISNVLLMGITFYIVFAIKAPQFAQPTEEGPAYSMEFMYANVAKAILLSFFELAVVMGIAVVASVIFSWILAAIFTFFVYFVGQMSEFFGHLADPDTGASPIARYVLGTVYRILPHFEKFDVREAILTDVPVVWKYVGTTIGMGAIYVTIVLALGYLFFSQREV
ncbi:MAG: ABC transporter permease subunit [Armatimonadota bacterium]|nr:ABC transporter permease subunit [Armatimonadota bacterium]